MKNKKQIDIGISFRREHPPETVLAYAREAEALGFEELWVVEDCFYASGIASAAAILANTERIRVGLGIMPAVARNPVFTAMEIATIGRMYPGRFIAGVGHGVARWMKQIGAFPRSQLTALREAVEITRGLTHGNEIDYTGTLFTLHEGRLEYPPVEVPPIYLGVRGPKSLALSGEIADGTILAEFSSPEYVAQARARIEEGNTRSQPHHVTVFVYTCATDSVADGIKMMRPLVAKAIASGRKDMYFDVFDNPTVLRSLKALGEVEEIAERIPDQWITQMAIMGKRDDWEKQMDLFAGAGADTIVLAPLPDKLLDQAEVFADVMFDHKHRIDRA